ncbi:MAG: DUF4010 domain-containing protein [Candidatus Aenigmatarchaeota archaeon]
MVEELFLKIVLSLGIGALVGIEREQRAKGEVAQGIRTFMLASLLGFLSTHFSFLFQSFLPFYIAFCTAGVLTALAYLRKTREKHVGQTTNFAFLITFLLGVLLYFDTFPFYLSISLAILLTFILASKEILHTFSKHLTKKEIWNAVFFAVLSFVILPVLPNHTVDPFNSINPFLIWSSVVIVLSLSFVAYILMKIFGPKKGIILSGILGGIVSSVAVTISMASDAKKNKKIFYSAVFSIVLASSTMFLRMFFVSIVFNYNLAFQIFAPLAMLSVLGYFLSMSFLDKIKKEKPKLILRSPLDLKVALRFGVFFTIAMMVINIAKNYFSETVLYSIAFITGLADVDAIVISLSSLALTSISSTVAIKGIILAAISNTFSKWLLALWLGNRKVALDVGKVFSVLILVGAAILFFI